MDLELKLASMTIGGIIGIICVVLLCIKEGYNMKDTISSILIGIGLFIMIVVSELAGVWVALILMIPIAFLILKIQSN